jgi:hypothetical protein
MVGGYMFQERRRLMSVLSKMGIGEVNSFETRLYNQKAVLILGKLGIQGLNYTYNWYVHGPYSPDLAKDLYESQSILQLIKRREIPPIDDENDERILGIFQKLRTDLESLPPSGDIHSKLELFASILFLVDKIPSSLKSKRKQIIINSLPKMKNQFQDWKLEHYWEIAGKYKLV